MTQERLTFRFQKCLGAGGFGEVYLAMLQRPGGLERQVAVKVLRDDLSDTDEAVRRLRDEGRMLAILDHPAILSALELCTIEGRVALVTEYVDGVDLSKCCKKGRLLPQRAVVGVIAEVASALHCAWTTPSPETGKPLKLIHRDIKPENIRISKHGAIKLLDFGIARSTEMVRHARTAMGDLPFTPGYAAPEAFTRGFQGSSSDVYALGVTMYRLLYGERLYGDMKLEEQVGIACLQDRYDPFLDKMLAREADVRDDVRDLLRRMVAYEPSERPTALEVQQLTEQLADTIEGQTYARWARSVNFPEPKEAEGSLIGRTVQEDPPDATPQSKRSRRRKRASDDNLPSQPSENPIDSAASSAFGAVPDPSATPAPARPRSGGQASVPPPPPALGTMSTVIPDLANGRKTPTTDPAPKRVETPPPELAPAPDQRVNVRPTVERRRNSAPPPAPPAPLWMRLALGVLLLTFIGLIGVVIALVLGLVLTQL